MYTLEVLPTSLAIVRYPSDVLPDWVLTLGRAPNLWSITRTDAELSIICDVSAVPEDQTAHVSQPWRALRVVGQLDFGLTGVLASLAVPLAEAGISIFALSTFDTDYLLVNEEMLEPACKVLARAGFPLA